MTPAEAAQARANALVYLRGPHEILYNPALTRNAERMADGLSHQLSHARDHRDGTLSPPTPLSRQWWNELPGRIAELLGRTPPGSADYDRRVYEYVITEINGYMVTAAWAQERWVDAGHCLPGLGTLQMDLRDIDPRLHCAALPREEVADLVIQPAQQQLPGIRNPGEAYGSEYPAETP
jgi:hypothetical protein